jgi:SAM-dependent methyltransferase
MDLPSKLAGPAAMLGEACRGVNQYPPRSSWHDHLEAMDTAMTPPRPLWPRLHLFELLDQDWYPSVLRDHATNYLATISLRMGLFDAMAPLLLRGLEAGGTDTVLDLGSGGGGPLPRLRDLLAREQGRKLHVVQSDLFPNARARERAAAAGAEYLEQPVDALRVPPEQRGMRTLFNALHHFRPEAARAVLADAQARGVPIGVFEVVERSPKGVLSALFIPLLVLLFTPLVRPLTLPRLLLTYVMPVFPLVIFWDGLVSSLRAHRPEELRRMTESLAREGYTWEVGEARMPGKPPVTYVLGLPTPTA